MRTSSRQPTFRSTKWALAPLIIVLWTALLSQCCAATVVVGETTHFRNYPFGTTSGGTAAYVGYYQQIYNSGYFEGESLISQIAFKSAGVTAAIDRTYILSIRLGVTSRSPMNLGIGFAAGTTPVLYGAIIAQLTPTPGDWDLRIDLPTPFLYDANLGNLLMDISVISATGDAEASRSISFLGQGTTNAVGCIYTTGTSIVAQPGVGLSTQFTVNPVPEPAIGVLLFLGMALCMPRRVRAPLLLS